MTNTVVLCLCSVAVVAGDFWYLLRRFPPEGEERGTALAKKHRPLLALTALLLVGLTGVQGLHPDISLGVSLRWTVIFWGMFLLAYIDRKERLIPNQVLLALFLLRLPILGWEIWQDFYNWQAVILFSVVGAAIGGGILAVVMLISRQGIGMGDVKMFLIIGLYVGSTAVFPTLFYTALASALAGAVLLILRKAGLHDSMPMAPFAFLGLAVEYVLLMTGG